MVHSPFSKISWFSCRVKDLMPTECYTIIIPSLSLYQNKEPNALPFWQEHEVKTSIQLKCINSIYKRKVREITYMEKNTNWMATTNGVLILLQVLFEWISITCLNYLHAHSIQGLNRFIYRTMLFIIICVAKPERYIIMYQQLQ